LEKVTKYIDKTLSYILIFLMAAMVLAVTWQVFTRFILREPSSYTEELARFLLIWIGLLGASYALRTRAHLGIDLISHKIKDSRRYFVEVVVYSMVILFAFFIMIIGGIRLVLLTFTLNQISASLGIKMGYVYLVIPLSGLLIIYYSLRFILNAISGKTEYILNKVAE